MNHWNSFSQRIKSKKRLTRKHHFSVVVGQYKKLRMRKGDTSYARECRRCRAEDSASRRARMTFEEANHILMTINSEERKNEAYKAFDCDYFHCICISCENKPHCYRKEPLIKKCNFFKESRPTENSASRREE